MAGLQERHELTWGCFESMRFICKGEVLMLDFVFAQIQLSLLWHPQRFSELLQKQAKKSQLCSMPIVYPHSGLLVSSFDLHLCEGMV
jgi:hypothetical protein